MSGSIYWVVFDSVSYANPTAAQIVAASSWVGTTAYGSAAAIESSGTQTFPAVAITEVGTYKAAFVFYDGVTYSAISVSSAVTVTEADISYPRWIQTIQSEEALEDDIRHERSSNGMLHTRVMWAAPIRVFNVHHVISTTNMQHLDNFYLSKRGRTFSFVWNRNNASYQVRFRSPPTYTQLGANTFEVRVQMETA